MAAGGGRMGGRSFTSRSRSSSSPWYWRPHYEPSPVEVASRERWSLALFLMFATPILLAAYSSGEFKDGLFAATEKTTILKVQVGLLGMGRAVQRDLERIARTADTSTLAGLSYVLTDETFNEFDFFPFLIKRRHYLCYGILTTAFPVDVKRSMEDNEKRFDQLSLEERGKFDEETLVNVDNIKSQRPSGFSNEYVVVSSAQDSGSSNAYIVVTVLVATKGELKLPEINVRKDLEDALQKLSCILPNKILAVEVLWTPQNENETLSEQKLHDDYPLLRPFLRECDR